MHVVGWEEITKGTVFCQHMWCPHSNTERGNSGTTNKRRDSWILARNSNNLKPGWVLFSLFVKHQLPFDVIVKLCRVQVTLIFFVSLFFVLQNLHCYFYYINKFGSVCSMPLFRYFPILFHKLSRHNKIYSQASMDFVLSAFWVIKMKY